MVRKKIAQLFVSVMFAGLSFAGPRVSRNQTALDKYVFAPDSSQFYIDGLKGETLLPYVPNTRHDLEKSDAPFGLAAFYEMILKGIPLPKYSWKFEKDGSYVARVDIPSAGWTAFFVELTYPTAGMTPLKVTTGVQVLPDTLPFPPPKTGVKP